MKKYIVFDFDGTIARTLDTSVMVINQLAIKSKLRQIEKEDVEVFRNEGWRMALKRFRISPLRVPRLALRVQKELKKYITEVEVEPGLKQVLEKLRKQGLVLGVLTSNSRENVEAFLDKNDMKMFEFIYADKSIFGKEKTMKKMIKERKMNIDEIIYIGDEVRDWEACKKIGMEMIGVGWGFNSKKLLKQVGVKKIVSKPEGLFEKIWS